MNEEREQTDVKWLDENPLNLPTELMDEWTKFTVKGGIAECYDDVLCQYLKSKHHFMQYGGILYLYQHGVFVPDQDETVIKTMIKKHLYKELRTSNRINRIHRLLLEDADIKVTEKDINNYPEGFEHFVNFKNGMYNPTKKTMYKHDPKFKSINQIPWEYYPEGDHGEGKEITKFLNYSMPNEDDQKTLFEYSGLSCTTQNDFQKAMMIYGDGGTGKSTIVELIRYMIGNDNVSTLSLQQLEEKFHAIKLANRLINIFNDLPADRMDDCERFKLLASGEPISDSYKGKDVIEFKPYAKLLFATNSMPGITDRSFGFFRRLVILKMDKRPATPDPKLLEKMKKEMPYFIHQCMEHLHDCLKRGSLTESESSVKLVRNYRAANDSTEVFVAEWIERRKGSFESRKDLYSRYETVCEELRFTALTPHRFYESLERKSMWQTARNGERGFKDVRLLSKDEHDARILELYSEDTPAGGADGASTENQPALTAPNIANLGEDFIDIPENYDVPFL